MSSEQPVSAQRGIVTTLGKTHTRPVSSVSRLLKIVFGAVPCLFVVFVWLLLFFWLFLFLFFVVGGGFLGGGGGGAVWFFVCFFFLFFFWLLFVFFVTLQALSSREDSHKACNLFDN